MKSIAPAILPQLIHGAVSLDVSTLGVQPWRLDHPRLDLFEKALHQRGMDTAGVRLALLSNTRALHLSVDPCFDLKPLQAEPKWHFDLLVDGQLHRRIAADRAVGTISFTDIPRSTGTPHRLEVFLPLESPVRLTSVAIDADATFAPFVDNRPKWLVYGSSITQCRTAGGPSESWPALVARQFNLNLTALGYGGNCHLEPVVAHLLRDLPADFISLCLGINVQGQSSLSDRTFRAAVLGVILTIREKHPHTPMVVVSPIYSLPRETKPNAVGLSLAMMRDIIKDLVTLLTHRGDTHLHYFDGLTLFGPEFASYLPDQLHPDAQGYRILAQRYAEMVMPLLAKSFEAGSQHLRKAKP